MAEAVEDPGALEELSVAVPVSTARRIHAIAEAQGIESKALMASWVEAQLGVVEGDRLISFQDAVAALAALRRNA